MYRLPRDPTCLVLRLSVAFFWLWTGALCLREAFPQCLVLLARCGLRGPPAPLAVEALGALHLAFGAATVLLPGPWLRPVLLFQGLVVSLLTGALTLALPEQWFNPLGPLSKSVPLLAALYTLYTLSAPAAEPARR